jgi:hypothetical protein
MKYNLYRNGYGFIVCPTNSPTYEARVAEIRGHDEESKILGTKIVDYLNQLEDVKIQAAKAIKL